MVGAYLDYTVSGYKDLSNAVVDVADLESGNNS